MCVCVCGLRGCEEEGKGGPSRIVVGERLLVERLWCSAC